MSPLLITFEKILRKNIVDEKHIAETILHWPARDLDEGEAWLGVIRRTRSNFRIDVNMLEALGQTFGEEIWAVGQGLQRPLAWAFELERRDNAYGNTISSEGRLFLTEHAPKIAWSDVDLFENQYRWLAHALPEGKQYSTNEHEATILKTLQTSQWDLNSETWGPAIGMKIRQPEHFKAWMERGGNLSIQGWDQHNPEGSAEDFFRQFAPALIPILPTQSRQATEQGATNEAVMAYWKTLEDVITPPYSPYGRTRRKPTAERLWDHLVRAPEKLTWRHPEHGQTPLQFSLDANPAILPLMLREVRKNPDLLTTIQMRSPKGSGIWATLIQNASHISLTENTLDGLASILPPEQEKNLVEQCLLLNHQTTFNYTNEPIVFARFSKTQWISRDNDQKRLAKLAQTQQIPAQSVSKCVKNLNLLDCLDSDLALILLVSSISEYTKKKIKSTDKNPVTDQENDLQWMDSLIHRITSFSETGKTYWHREKEMLFQTIKHALAKQLYSQKNEYQTITDLIKTIDDRLQKADRLEQLQQIQPARPSRSSRMRS